MSTSKWRRSSFSSNGTNCVEVAAGAVRDSKNGAVLTLDARSVRALVQLAVRS